MHTVSLLSTLWVSNTSVRKWTLSRPCDIFQRKHDEVVQQLVTISCMDDLLSGKHTPICICTLSTQIYTYIYNIMLNNN